MRFNADQAKTEMEAGTQHYNQMAFVHRRILYDLVDAAIGVFMASSFTAGKTLSTLKLLMNYLRLIHDGGLTISSRIVCRGRTTS